MSYERTKLWLQGAGLGIAAIALMGAASHWAIEKLVASELAPLAERVKTLEDTSKRTADSLEALQESVQKLLTEQAVNSEILKRLDAKAHSHQ